jgi:hypothetical protein
MTTTRPVKNLIFLILTLLLAWSPALLADSDPLAYPGGGVGALAPLGSVGPLPQLAAEADPMADLAAPLSLEGLSPPWADRPASFDILLKDADRTPAGRPYPSFRDGGATTLSRSLMINRTLQAARPPAPEADPHVPSLTPAAGQEYQATNVAARLDVSRLFLDDRLTLSGGLAWDRSVYDPLWSLPSVSQPPAVDTMTYGFGANMALGEDWSVGASVTARKSTTTAAGMDRRPPEAWQRPPSDLVMGRVGLQLLKRDWGLKAWMTAFAGRMGEAGEPNREAETADVQGVELGVRQSLLDTRLNLEVAAMLSYLKTRRMIDSHLSDGPNLSGYLGLSFTDPTIINASLLLRYAGNGDYVNNYFLGDVGASSFFDARVWRDFSISPALTLSTQLYGSSFIEAFYQNLSQVGIPPVPYLEGRVTMSYSF